MSADGRNVAAPSSSRTGLGDWRLWALLVSLTANMFLGGVLFGRTWVRGPAVAPVRGNAAGFGARIRTLPPPDRLRFAGSFARHRPEIRAARAELRAKGEAARAALVATPYDAGRAEVAFADVRAASSRLQAAIQTALLDSVAGLSAESRTRLAAPPASPEPPPATP